MADGTDSTAPALSGAEWRAVLENRAQLDAIREQLLDTPFSAHAVAALLLYGEPFGFTQQDVDDEIQVAGYAETMAKQLATNGQNENANTFSILSQRHRDRAARIAALLPPR